MVISLIKVDSAQLLDTFNNARAISTLCLHMCQHILEFRMAQLRADCKTRQKLEKQLSVIQWYFSKITGFAELGEISAMPALQILSATLIQRSSGEAGMRLTYHMFDLSLEGFSCTTNEVINAFMMLLIRESIKAMQKFTPDEPDYKNYAEQCLEKLATTLGLDSLTHDKEVTALLRLRFA